MVAGGISIHGPGKLIFLIATMNSCAYKKALKYYSEDVRRLIENLYFQQDNATCHTSKESIKYISENFKQQLRL
jgi:hypothetical protein